MVEAASILSSLGVAPSASADGEITVCSPIDGSLLGRVHADDAASVAAKIARAEAAFHEWSLVPAPRRGELIRLLGTELRAAKRALGLPSSAESANYRFRDPHSARVRRPQGLARAVAWPP